LRVFVAYSGNDPGLGKILDPVIQRLQREHGFTFFRDAESIRPFDRIESIFSRDLDQSQIVLFFLSHHDSASGYAATEKLRIIRGFESHSALRVIPVVLGDPPVEKDPFGTTLTALGRYKELAAMTRVEIDGLRRDVEEVLLAEKARLSPDLPRPTTNHPWLKVVVAGKEKCGKSQLLPKLLRETPIELEGCSSNTLSNTPRKPSSKIKEESLAPELRSAGVPAVVLNCPSCGRANEVPAGTAGGTLRCHHCTAFLPSAPASGVGVASGMGMVGGATLGAVISGTIAAAIGLPILGPLGAIVGAAVGAVVARDKSHGGT
jgi:hypothetical protein